MAPINLVTGVTCIWILLLSKTVAISYSEMDTLFKSNLKDKNIDIRPVLDQSKTLKVFLEFQMFYIQGFDEVAGEIDISGYLKVVWQDETVSWDANKTGVDSFTFNDDKTIWTPNIFVLNSYGGAKQIYQDDNLKRVFSDGTVLWDPTDIFEIICNVDMSKFPFDSHTCSILFRVWGYRQGEVTLINVANEVGLQHYFPSNTWNLGKTNVYNIEEYNVLVFEINIERQSVFFIINLILPIFVLNILNICAFFLPPESGERIGFSVTVLLAIAVFLTISSDQLPGTSQPRLPSLSLLLFAEVVVSSMIVLQIVCSLRYYHSDDKVPVSTLSRIFVKVSRFIRCHAVCNARGNKEKYQDCYRKDITWRDVAVEIDCIGVIFTSLLIIIINLLFVVDVTIGLPILDTNFKPHLI